INSADALGCPPTGCVEDVPKLSLTGVWIGQVAVAVLAVLAATNEYGTGMIATTMIGNPRRWMTLVARATVVTGATLVVGTVAVMGSLVSAWIVLPRRGLTPDRGYAPLTLVDEPVLRASGGTVLYFGLVALLGLGVATV